MRVGHVEASRLQYYDRNPVPGSNDYIVSNAPHAQTTRFTYTVASGKKAFIEHVFCRVLRVTVAAPANEADSVITYQPNAGSERTIFQASLFTNAIGDKDSQETSSFGEAGAGDAFRAKTSDISTGGTVIEQIHLKYNEFDA